MDASAVEAKAAAPAASAASFEDLRARAVPATDLATLIEPLYGRCDEPEDLPRRQCEGIRSFLLQRLRNELFVAHADVAPDISPYDAGAKEIDIEVSGCLACTAPPVVAGEPRLLATRLPQRMVGSRPVGVPLATYQLPMETRVQADRFLERVGPRLQVEHVFRIAQPFPEAQGTSMRGVQIVPVAHRVYDRCTGKVVASSLPSQAVPVQPDQRCPARGVDELSRAELALQAERAALPERLSPSQVEAALQPVQAKIHECYVEYQELSGTVRVQLVLSGEGKLTHIGLSPPFDKAAIGVCIRSQIKTATFPRFRGEPMRIEYAFQVH
ncbi:MAG: hypothetical protein RMK29_15095 [Myxococcales bacterium]|nr:hypothetical protein [Myxococcales bacterium]